MVTKRQANTYRNRLLKLADFLRTVPKKKFFYGDWTSAGVDTIEDLEGKCGTTACAMGWVPSIPTFKKLGARMRFGMPETKTGQGVFSLAEQLFGVTRQEFDFLFIPGEKTEGYAGLPKTASPKVVARHIERFLKTYRPEDR